MFVDLSFLCCHLKNLEMTTNNIIFKNTSTVKEKKKYAFLLGRTEFISKSILRNILSAWEELCKFFTFS
jgi:hypothetical protein